MTVQLLNGAKNRPSPGLRCGDTLEVLRKPGLDLASLRNKAKADPAGYAQVLQDLVTRRGDLACGRSENDRDAEEFSFAKVRDLRSMREAFDFEIEVPIPARLQGEGQRAQTVMTSAFPLVTNSLIVAGVNDSYEAVETVGEQLVQEMDDPKKLTAMVGVLSLSKDDKRRGEGNEYTLISAGEEKFLIEHLDQGVQMTISQELFEENNIPEIEARLLAIGEIAREEIEEQTIRRVTDHDGSGTTPAEPYVLHHPGNSGNAIFQTDADPLSRLPSDGSRVTNNPLNDVTAFSSARARLAGMKNSRGKRIMIPRSELVLFVPDALVETAWHLLNSVQLPGVVNQQNFFGPNGMVRPALISTPKLDDLSSTAWYWGAPRKQFRRKWKLRPEISTFSGTGTEAFTRTRTAVRIRVGWDMEVGAIDYVYWLQNLAATTAPKA